MLQPARQFARYRALFGRLRDLLSRRTKLLMVVLALAFAGALTEGVGLSMLYPLLDGVVGGTQDQGSLWQALRDLAMRVSGTSVIEGFIYLAVVVFFVKAVLLSANTAFTSLLTGRLQEDWSTAALRHYLCGPYAGIVAERRGQIMQNITSETSRATKGIETLLTLITKLIFALVLILTLFILNWRLMLMMSALLLIVALLAPRLMLKPMQKLGRKRMSTNQAASATVAESIFGAATVKLLGIEDTFLTRQKSLLRRLARIKVLISVFSKAPNDFVEFAIVVTVALLFLVLAHGFGIPFQEAIPLIGAFAIVSSRLLTVVSSLLSKRLSIASITPSLVLVHQMVSESSTFERREKGATLSRVESDIEFRDVWFGYDAEKPVFEGLSLTIPKNRLVGIVGPSGIGKSTLGYLLARLYEPDRGNILINNRDIRDFSIESLRRRIGYVEQTPIIFNGTIEENIRIGQPDASRGDVIEAAKAAGVHEFVLSLPRGYDTPVSDQGATLSGGERQRIAIARAVIRRPDVFLIDEGTSALDRISEATIQDSIQKLARDATVIVIAHRVSTLKDADVIFELLPGGEAVVRTFEEVAA